MKKSIPTQIPVPGGSGITPTGAMQFENDWPGLFVRGDNAVTVSFAIRTILEHHGKNPPGELLTSLMTLEGIADIIDNHVIVRGDQTDA